MPDIAVCVTVFKRIDKLDTLLHSVDPEFISTVYVADDGEWTEEREEIYSQSFPFELEVFNLEFDAGLGAGRNKIVEEADAEYLLLMDSDMQMPENADVLLHQLKADPELGGVCGLFAEKNRIYTSGCLDIYEENSTCKPEIRDRKETELLAGYPFIEFDMIANAALFRRECLADYSWDPEYVIEREHIDFYVGHKRLTDWKFGLCPSVLFPHDPGGSSEYTKHRRDEQKHADADEYFLNKWGYDRIGQINHSWMDTYDPEFSGFPPHGMIARARRKFRKEGIPGLAKAFLRRVR
ncbi:glycosyltransferase family 2 protein [Halosimplex pelagicum]|uniref:Glycosyltransferase n=1 Tax=Halosimplex pelagicum TaxID=869886 RepID=A0A7D5TTA4_9EURY|nr:glycosyltransferase [Halosimplex pelagicum]QLH81214.1 glycosyltransferase [Halosimplex pelagicum]